MTKRVMACFANNFRKENLNHLIWFRWRGKSPETDVESLNERETDRVRGSRQLWAGSPGASLTQVQGARGSQDRAASLPDKGETCTSNSPFWKYL